MNSFKMAKTAVILDKSDCSSGLAKVMQKQKNAQMEEWTTFDSDTTIFVGLFDGEIGPESVEDLPVKSRKHVLLVFTDVLNCHIAVEEYFNKQWNAIGALFSLIWEKDFEIIALDIVKKVLRMSPSNTDSEIAKSVLFTRYVEALPRAQSEIHTMNLYFRESMVSNSSGAVHIQD